MSEEKETQPLSCVATIIICFGKVNETRQAIQTLLEDTYQQNHILIVENKTTENTEMLSHEFPSVTFLNLSKNEGFAGGNNRGILEAKKRWNPDFYFLLNNDAQVEKGAIAALVKTMKNDPRCGLATPKILYERKKRIFWAAGGEVIPWRCMARNRGQGIEDVGQYDRQEFCSFLSGCALMIRKDVIEKVGLLDERFFIYAEDLDYCLRTKKDGWKLIYNPEATVYHYGSATSGGEYEPFQSFFRWRNRFFIAHKHFGFFKKLILYTTFFPVLMFRDMLTYLRKGKVKSIPYLWKGLFQLFSGIPLGEDSNPLNSIIGSDNSSRKIRRLHSGYLMTNPIMIIFFRIVDFGGSLFFTFLKRSRPTEKPKKILIAKIDHLGDVLMSLYVLPVIKKAFPDAEIHYVCGSWCQKIVQNNPFVKQILTFDHCRLNRNGSFLGRFKKMISDFISVVKIMRKEKYDIAMDLRGYFPNFLPILAFGNVRYKLGYATGGFGFLLDKTVVWREGVHETEHFFDLLREFIESPQRENPQLDYLIDSQGAEKLLKDFKVEHDRPIILIHAFCQKSNLRDFKSWRTEEWKKVIRFLENKGYMILCTGDEDDAPFIRRTIEGTSAINLAGKTSLYLLSGLIKKAKYVICIDTFVSHLSAALGAKTIVIFNHGEPVEQWRPWGNFVEVIPIESHANSVLSKVVNSK